MPSTQSFESAWGAYQKAVRDLYAAPAGVASTADRSVGEIYADRLDQRSDVVLTRSEEVRSVLANSLETADLNQRELAALKLLAAAAHDLSVANDLLELEQAGPTGEVERGARGTLLAADELRSILDAPLQAGVRGLLEVERSALPDDPEAARKKLEATIAAYLKEIPQDAAKLSQGAVGGVINLGLGPVQSAASVAAQEVLARVPDGLSLVIRRAATLVVEAIRKLATALGKEQQEEVQKEVTGWLKDIQGKRDTVSDLLARLYETQRIAAEAAQLLAAAPSGTPAARYNQATRILEELLARYDKTKGVLDWLVRILAFVKTPLLGAAPWGPVALYATYAGVLGYAVYSGGDYLDWYRTGDGGWLDRVQGLRTTVRQALSTP